MINNLKLASDYLSEWLSHFQCELLIDDNSYNFNVINFLISKNKIGPIKVGYLSWPDYNIYRLYKKHEYLVDINPLQDLLLSEIFQLYKYFGFTSELKFTFDHNSKDVDWISEEELKYKIITSELDPTKSKHWIRFTKKQKELISFLYNREKLTRHKQINWLYPKVRHMNFIS